MIEQNTEQLEVSITKETGKQKTTAQNNSDAKK